MVISERSRLSTLGGRGTGGAGAAALQVGGDRQDGPGHGEGAGRLEWWLRPSQDAPDASVGSVCVQGDQDSGRADGVSLLAGPGGGPRSGGVILGIRLPVGLGGLSQHLLTCPAPQRSPDSTWGSCRLWARDTDICGWGWWAPEGWAKACVAVAKCVHTCGRGWIGLSARDPRAQGWTHIARHVRAGVDETWARTGGPGERQALTQYLPGPYVARPQLCSRGPAVKWGNGGQQPASAPPPRAPACKSRRTSPAPSFSQHGAQTSVPLPPSERARMGPRERRCDRSRERSGIQVLLWPCSSEQGQGIAMEFRSWMWALRSPREPWPLRWGGDPWR